MNRTLQIYNLTLKKYITNPVEFIADTMTTTPDKIVSIPLWFGSFMNEFKKDFEVRRNIFGLCAIINCP